MKIFSHIYELFIVRCDAVFLYNTLSLVDAKFSAGNNRFSAEVTCKILSKDQLLIYKYILSIQVNDISSRLK